MHYLKQNSFSEKQEVDDVIDNGLSRGNESLDCYCS